jgi:hypothetical protein
MTFQDEILAVVIAILLAEVIKDSVILAWKTFNDR